MKYLLVGDDEKTLYVSDDNKHRSMFYNEYLDEWIDGGSKLWEISVGFDESEPIGSPYRWGNISSMPDIVEISKEQAETFINKKIDEGMIIKLLRL